MFAKLEKPYSASSGWSEHFAYTYSDAKTTSKEWKNDIFDWTYGRPGARGWNPSTEVDRHRLVIAGVFDRLLPWGMTVAAKATLASGMPRRLTNCTGGFDTSNGQVGCIAGVEEIKARAELDDGAHDRRCCDPATTLLVAREAERAVWPVLPEIHPVAEPVVVVPARAEGLTAEQTFGHGRRPRGARACP